MKTMFSDLKDIGNLYLLDIFLLFECEPLLFTCIDDKENMYFCHCYKLQEEQKWFIVPITLKQVEQMKNKTMDIRTAIVSSERILNITLHVDGTETNKWITANEINEEDLPINGIYLKESEKNENHD